MWKVPTRAKGCLEKECFPPYFWVTGQFSSVQSLSRVWLFATPWIAARQASLSITNSWSSPRVMCIESVMPSSHLTLWHLTKQASLIREINLKSEWSYTKSRSLREECHDAKVLLKVGSGCSPLESQYLTGKVQFSQFSCSVLSNSLRPHESQHARPPCPSQSPRVHPNSRPLSRWCHPAISSSVVPFSFCPQSLPASESFPISQLFTSGGQSIGVSALASFLPKNAQDWSPFEWTGWISLQSKGLSRVFSNTTVQKHQFFGT